MRLYITLLFTFIVTSVQAQNPLVLNQAYASTSASFTLPPNVLLQNGRVIVQDEAEKARKTQFIRALGAIDEALETISNKTATAASKTAQATITATNAPPPAIATPAAQNPLIITPDLLAYPFIEIRDTLFTALQSATSPTAKNVIREDLARLNLSFGRYEEAIGILENFPKDAKYNMPHSSQIRILLGMAYALNKDTNTALPLLIRSGEPRDHRMLWRAYSTPDTAEARQLFDQNQSLISSYPPALDERLTRRYAQTLINIPERTADVMPLLENLATRLNGADLAPETLYVLAQAQELNGNTNASLQTLADVAESGESFIAYQAKYDFINRLHRQGDLSNDATINALETLARVWRGDSLEENILLDLGRLHLAQKDYRKALNYLKDYARHYPEGEARERVAYLMTRNFLSAFNETNALMTDDLGFLSLYYDFRELTPADSRGDKLITQVAERLERLNLFNQARDLFEQQLTFRVDNPTEKTDIALELSRLHRKNNDAASALSVLTNIDTTSLNSRRKNDVLLERAKANYAQENYATAKQILQQIGTDTARDMLIDIAWQQQDATTLIALIQPMFNSGEHSGFVDEKVRNHFMRLAYAFAQKQDLTAIQQLRKNFPDAIKDYPEIADAIAFATARGGAQDVIASPARPVGRLASELSKINDLFADYNTVSSGVQTRKRAREIFNQKMRYMEQRQRGGG